MTYAYDTGALVAAERGDPEVWRLHRHALASGRRPVIPAGVIAQAWCGGPQRRLAQLVRGCEIEALDADRAREAGALLARSRTSDVVDATVVLAASRHAVRAVTSDPRDLRVLAAHAQPSPPLTAL